MSGDHRLTLKQACELLGKKERTVRRYVQTGQLSKVYVDGDNGWELRLSEAEVRALASGVPVPRVAADVGGPVANAVITDRAELATEEAEAGGLDAEEMPLAEAVPMRTMEAAGSPYIAVTGRPVDLGSRPPGISPAPSAPTPWQELATVRPQDDPGRLRLSEAFGWFFEQVQREHESGRDAYLLGLDEVLRQAGRSVTGAPGKGVWVLHMLRRTLGDERFWRALERFAGEHGFEGGTTEQLLALLRSEAGANEADRGRLTRFAPWFEHAGLPYLSTSWRWDPEGPGIRLTLAQTPDPSVSDPPPLYELPLTVRCLGPQGERSFAVTMTRREEEFFFQMTLRPRLVLVDPDHDLALVVQASKRIEEWLEQLRRGPDALHRVRAIDGLRGAWGAPDVESALREVVYSDACGGVRAAAARALAPVTEPWSVPAGAPGRMPLGAGGVARRENVEENPPSPPTPLPILGEGSLLGAAMPDSPSPRIGRGGGLPPRHWSEGWEEGVRAAEGEPDENAPLPVAAEVDQLKRELRRLRAEQAQIERALVLLELRTRPRVSEERADALPADGAE
jgi:hypothetical protein